jgi:hypothetical protein
MAQLFANPIYALLVRRFHERKKTVAFIEKVMAGMPGMPSQFAVVCGEARCHRLLRFLPSP